MLVVTCGVGTSGTTTMAAAGGNSVRAGPGCLKSIQPTSKTARAATMIILRLITARFGPGWRGSVTDERLRLNLRKQEVSKNQPSGRGCKAPARAGRRVGCRIFNLSHL